MKLIKTIGLTSLLSASVLVAPIASAATSPSLGAANTFTILSDTYVNTAPGTTLSADLGYTTGPAVAPTVGGNTHVADSVYDQAGIDQGSALTLLNNQPCTFEFAPGAIDLASDTTHGPVGVYTPGVYCITGAADIGGGGTITLNGVGTYIFRMDGALTSSAGSIVTAAGASACDVWWTPTQATTLGANSTFLGTNIDASGITIGNTVTWLGQALAFGGTVTTDTDTITSPTCPASRGLTPGESTTPDSSDDDTATPGLPNTSAAPSATIPLLLSVSAIILVTLLISAVVYKKRRSL